MRGRARATGHAGHRARGRQSALDCHSRVRPKCIPPGPCAHSPPSFARCQLVSCGPSPTTTQLTGTSRPPRRQLIARPSITPCLPQLNHHSLAAPRPTPDFTLPLTTADSLTPSRHRLTFCSGQRTLPIALSTRSRHTNRALICLPIRFISTPISPDHPTTRPQAYLPLKSPPGLSTPPFPFPNL